MKSCKFHSMSVQGARVAVLRYEGRGVHQADVAWQGLTIVVRAIARTLGLRGMAARIVDTGAMGPVPFDCRGGCVNG